MTTLPQFQAGPQRLATDCTPASLALNALLAYCDPTQAHVDLAGTINILARTNEQQTASGNVGPAPLGIMACLAWFNREPSRASKLALKALEQQANDAFAHWASSLLSYSRAHYTEAESHLHRAITGLPKALQPLLHWQLLEIKSHQRLEIKGFWAAVIAEFALVLLLLKTALLFIRAYPKQNALLALQAITLLTKIKPYKEKALAFLLKAHPYFPGSAALMHRLGHAYSASDKPEHAWYWFDKAFQRHPSSRSACWGLLQLKRLKNDLPEALRLARTMQPIAPSSPELLLVTAMLEEGLMQFDAARQHYLAALQLKAPTSVLAQAAQRLGQLSHAVYGRSEEAVLCYSWANQLQPDLRPSLGKLLGMLCLEQHWVEVAKATVSQQLAADQPSITRAVHWAHLGYIYSAEGEWSKAVEAYEKALHCNPNCEVALNNLAVIYMDCLNQSEAAYVLLEKAITLQPRYQVAQANMQRLLAQKTELHDASQNEGLTEADIAWLEQLSRGVDTSGTCANKPSASQQPKASLANNALWQDIAALQQLHQQTCNVNSEEITLTEAENRALLNAMYTQSEAVSDEQFLQWLFNQQSEPKPPKAS